MTSAGLRPARMRAKRPDDTDIPTVTAELQTDLTNYQSALYAVSQAVPETLAKYLN